MINKIGKITVYVQDQEQAKNFWLNKIGFVLKFEKPYRTKCVLDRSWPK